MVLYAVNSLSGSLGSLASTPYMYVYTPVCTLVCMYICIYVCICGTSGCFREVGAADPYFFRDFSEQCGIAQGCCCVYFFYLMCYPFSNVCVYAWICM